MAECLKANCDKLAAGFSLVNLDDTKELRDVLRAKCFVLAHEIGMTDEDRGELAVAVVGQDGSKSWGRMTYPQLGRLADYLSGWIFVETILRDRRSVAT